MVLVDHEVFVVNDCIISINFKRLLITKQLEEELKLYMEMVYEMGRGGFN